MTTTRCWSRLGKSGKSGEKFRGWDVCVTNTTTKLCHSTGDGS
ncbi:hypothetical protein [Streptomyces prunicolor]